MARLLIERGFTRVHPLAGGLDAWLDAGHLVEDDTIVVLQRQV